MLEIRSMSACYGKRTVLEGVSLSLERGELLAVVGENGCGKTTLLKAILGTVRREGEITVDGVMLDTLGIKERAKRISYLSQGRPVPDMTVLELVRHARFCRLDFPHSYSKTDTDKAKEIILRLGLGEYIDAPVALLSGGTRQRVYIAAALAQESDFILMDEPTSYLDAPHRVGLMKLLRSVACEGRGVLAVLHDVDLAMRYADRVAVMKDGRVICVDTPERVLEGGALERAFGMKIRRSDGSGRYYFDEEGTEEW